MRHSTVPKALPGSPAFLSLATWALTPNLTPPTLVCSLQRSSVLGGPVLSDTFWQSPKHCTRHATEPPTHPDNSTWLCLRAWPQENLRWEVSSCYRDRMEKLPAVPSGTLTLSKSRVPQVPSNKLRAIPSDCQVPVGPISSLNQSSWHNP